MPTVAEAFEQLAGEIAELRRRELAECANEFANVLRSMEQAGRSAQPRLTQQGVEAAVRDRYRGGELRESG